MTETFKTLKGDRFPTAHTFIDSYSTTGVFPHSYPVAKFLDEIRCIKFIQAVIQKPDWRNKIKLRNIIKKWEEEAFCFDLQGPVFKYAIKELKYLATCGDPSIGLEPSGVDFVWQSDKLIPVHLRDSFLATVKTFADSLTEKDYHPGSDDQVLNLVHPSLFCLVYGKTKDVNGNLIELDKTIPNPKGRYRFQPALDESNMWSRKFQWLPAEFQVDKEGKVKIGSYINSLPLSSGLYPIIADIFERVVPMFNRVLSDLRLHRLRVRFPWIRNEYIWWKEFEAPEEIFEGIDSDDDEAREEATERWEESRELIPLPIPDFNPANFTIDPEKMVDLKDHDLQVIVKIASIELTPENPKFSGGSWHVEGMANEKIVATAIYYYDSENIVDDCLNFRQSVDLDTMTFPHNDTSGSKKMFGLDRNDAMVQDAGTAQTPSGRVLVFPNIYQHAVNPFHLDSFDKPGHRKILVFFLVDPTQRITSTSKVPPQDLRWRDTELDGMITRELPVEVAKMITKQLGYRMTLEEAKQHRLELMEERSVAKDAVTATVFERPFRLCEH